MKVDNIEHGQIIKYSELNIKDRLRILKIYTNRFCPAYTNWRYTFKRCYVDNISFIFNKDNDKIIGVIEKFY